MKKYIVKFLLPLALFLSGVNVHALAGSVETSPCLGTSPSGKTRWRVETPPPPRTSLPAETDAAPYALYDTLEVIHNTLRLDIRRFAEKRLDGAAEITIRSKQDALAFAPLLLLHMQIDSIRVNGHPVGHYQYNDTLLRIPLDRPLSKGAQAKLFIAYHGRPVSAPFGGFVFSDSLRHAHNMGVSIHDNPHSFGRSWFPAIDDFRSRAPFDLYLRVDSTLKGIAGGTLQSVRPAPEGTAVWHWQIRQPIPDYLVGVAVGPYEKISYPYTSTDGRSLPVDIYVFPEEVEAARETYAFLPRALEILENHFGPYGFDRVGYVSVDRRGGAMEHVANISMPRGPKPTVGYRTLAIHELIHGWFGNRVTCRTARDMFLNEGITNFGPELVLEKLYGAEEAARYVRQNQLSALIAAPLREKGYLALAAVPDAHTYGTTVYDKGAMAMHTLRRYLGDDKLMPALKAYLEAYACRTATVAGFQDFMTRSTGIDLADFFDLWINQPGFTAFEIDSIRTTAADGAYQATVYIEQKRCHAPAFGRNVRLPLTFYAADGLRAEQREATVGGSRTAATFTLPFRPAFGLVDPGYALCKASLYEAYPADTAGRHTRLARYGGVDVVADSLPAGVSLHLEYYRVAPDPLKNPSAYRLCDTHYWRVAGLIPEAARLRGRFPVATEGPGADWLHTAGEVAQVCLMYRPDAAQDWRPVARMSLAAEPDTADDSPNPSSPASSAKTSPQVASRPEKGPAGGVREFIVPLLAGEYCLSAGK